MLYYIYKKEWIQANVSNFNMDIKFKHDLTQTSKENMENELKTYYDINEYIKMFLNKRNDNVSTQMRYSLYFFKLFFFFISLILNITL